MANYKVQWNNPVMQNIFKRIIAGETQRSVGNIYGVSGSRIGMILTDIIHALHKEYLATIPKATFITHPSPPMSVLRLVPDRYLPLLDTVYPILAELEEVEKFSNNNKMDIELKLKILSYVLEGNTIEEMSQQTTFTKIRLKKEICDIAIYIAYNNPEWPSAVRSLLTPNKIYKYRAYYIAAIPVLPLEEML